MKGLAIILLLAIGADYALAGGEHVHATLAWLHHAASASGDAIGHSIFAR